ncbi:porin [Moraxella sp.]|uniref:porin n=1 Tax=Moraxella sp. TaxID=479 RepID=UPI0026DC6C6D|nr:porin [Moraxella sp.]MDO4894770.1 porin [Moraxella sp.]
MKYSVLCCAVLSVLVSTSAMAAPRITGTIKTQIIDDTTHRVDKNLTTGQTTIDEKTGRPEFYGSSRLKVSGSEKINDVLTAYYSLEYDFQVDQDRETNNFRSRSTYISLDHKNYGRIRVGRMTNPEDDMDMAVTKGDNWGTVMPFTQFGGRANNAIQYYSPYFGKDKDIRVKLHYGMDENSEYDRTVRTTVDGRSVEKKRDVSSAVIMKNGMGLGWGASYARAGSDFDAITGMVRYNTEKWGLALVARQADYKTNDKEVGAFVSGVYNLEDDWQVYGQAGHVDHYRGGDSSSTIGAVGVSKDFQGRDGRTTIFAEAAGEKYKNKRTNSRGQIIDRQDDIVGFGVGASYKF